MTSKQKKALALSGLLLVWGVVLWQQFAGPSGSQAEADFVPDAELVDEETVETEASTDDGPALPAPVDPKVYQAIRARQIKTAAEPWTRDPFAPGKAMASNNAPQKPVEPDAQAETPETPALIIRLTSTFKTPGGRFAVVNGKSCKVGDVVDGIIRLTAIGDGWIDVIVNDPKKKDGQTPKRISLLKKAREPRFDPRPNEGIPGL